MGKKVRAIMNTRKRNHHGFSIVELLTAIAILAVLSVTVVFVMNSSSKTYSSLSVETQLQSEAQLVANMITELAIDSFDAKNKTDEDYGYPNGEGEILILSSKVDGDDMEYIIGRKASDNSLYLRDREFDSSTGWKPVTDEALLGNYITNFSVDTSRVEKENILMFSLTYEKSGRSYVGNYQVLMRNRAYADKEPNPATPQSGAILAVKINPTLVYIDIVDGDVTAYYENAVSDAEKVTLVSNGIQFNSEVSTNQNITDKKVNWSLKNADTEIFKMEPANSEKSYLKWDTSKRAFIDSAPDAFTIMAEKTISFSDGTPDLQSNPKTAQILLRRIKDLQLYALSGVTRWKTEYETVFGGYKQTGVDNYAYVGANGKYHPINLSASISASNIAYGGGVDWKLYIQDTKTGSWSECTKASYAKLTHKQTLTSTTNTVTLGNNASNGQIYKVVATSVFDPSFEAEYIFGVAPDDIPDKNGWNSRGFYTSMNSYWKGKKVQEGNEIVGIDEVLYVVCTTISGGNNPETVKIDMPPCSCTNDWNGNGVTDSNEHNQDCKVQATGFTPIDKVKIIGPDEEGEIKLYLDFDAYSYGKDQKATFYGGSCSVYVALLYRGTDGNIYFDGDQTGRLKNCVVDLANKAHGYTGEDIIDPSKVKKQRTDVKYPVYAVSVSKVSPAQDVVVIEKGKDQIIDVKTAYYNLLSPRRGTHYLGVFLDDMDTNLMEDGLSSVNAYFDVELTSRYGDTNKYVDEAVLNVTAKSGQKKYLTDPLTLRVTANDYYMINPGQYQNSYTDYKLLVANVEGTNCYIPGPKSKANGLAWPSAAETSKTSVTGYNSNGAAVTATVYKSGNRYYCEYGGRKYTYSNTYGVWKK